MSPSRFPAMSGMSRRGVLAAGGALGAGALLAACGDPDSPAATPDGAPGGAKPAAGPFSFTDDRKRTVTLDHPPAHLVAYVGSAAALYDYGIRCAGVFGPTRLKDGSPDAQAGDLDVAEVTVLGNVWGEFAVEKYAALSPGLLISHMYDAKSLWYVPEQSAAKILGIAPSAGINVTGVPLTTPLRRYAELAAALGADLASAANAAAKTRFETASAGLRAAAKSAGGLTVMAASASTESFYVSTPSSASDLTYYQSLGVDFIVPDKVEGGFFETLSWEAADKYKADVIMLDNRSATLQPEDLTGRPTWRQLPAVKAGQVHGWPSEPIFSYAKCADQIEALTKAVTGAKKVS
ncbi:ABC transporter substrate-binding protein [Actinacidiphila paucisporea]|uniref:Iron complex transport system substrate-binding protein n=1 Tax=Actinacidiphila paucisporea TaxID=310782 RepID=A0A1M7P3G8_9ACTN|nr:ABC transporter substrate-binding protein [Actinacidiphila paucisporea]SHN11040.1 iron complex transport system substrate-binding protein [Actinacidiphila paucisporea]